MPRQRCDRRLFPTILGSVASGFNAPDFGRKGTEEFLQPTSPQALSAFNAANARIDIRDLLPRVTAPTRIEDVSRPDSRAALR